MGMPGCVSTQTQNFQTSGCVIRGSEIKGTFFVIARSRACYVLTSPERAAVRIKGLSASAAVGINCASAGELFPS